MEDLKNSVKKLVEKVGVENKRKTIRMIEAESTRADFWQDHQSAAVKMKELATLQKEIEEIELLQMWIEEGEYAEDEKLLIILETLLFYSSPHIKGTTTDRLNS